MRFSEDFLEELRFRNDIQSVISPYVALRPGGRTMVGLCPFHNERTPSFTVYLDSQSYYCFGCGAGGDCITFIKTAENLDYTEAVKYLAEKSGMSLPIDSYDDGVGKLRNRIYEMNRAAARFFYASLVAPSGEAAQAYVLSRGLTQETCKRFGLGYAPNQWDALLKHLKQSGFSEDEILTASLARRTQKGGVIDVFRNRLMFPVMDLRGNVIAFTGRVFDKADENAPKYVNSPESLVYKKSQVLYALNLAKNNNDRKLILCEGNMDVIALHQAGFTNAVAAMGTSFTHGHAKLLATYADEILLAYDSDAAGQKAIAKVLSILETTALKTRVIQMRGGKDPDEIIRTHGKERMRDILNGALNDTEFRLLQAASGLDITAPDGKIAYLNKAVSVLASLRNPMERDIYITKTSSDLEVAKDAIITMVEKEIKQRKKRDERTVFTDIQKQITGHPNIAGTEKAYSAKTKRAEETLVRSLLHNPDFCAKLSHIVRPELFFSEIHKKLYFTLAEKIQKNEKIELTHLAGKLTDEEMGILARLMNDKSMLSNTLTECADCVEALKAEKSRTSTPNAAALDDDAFRQLFRKSPG